MDRAGRSSYRSTIERYYPKCVQRILNVKVPTFKYSSYTQCYLKDSISFSKFPQTIPGFIKRSMDHSCVIPKETLNVEQIFGTDTEDNVETLLQTQEEIVSTTPKEDTFNPDPSQARGEEEASCLRSNDSSDSEVNIPRTTKKRTGPQAETTSEEEEPVPKYKKPKRTPRTKSKPQPPAKFVDLYTVLMVHLQILKMDQVQCYWEKYLECLEKPNIKQVIVQILRLWKQLVVQYPTKKYLQDCVDLVDLPSLFQKDIDIRMLKNVKSFFTISQNSSPNSYPPNTESRGGVPSVTIPSRALPISTSCTIADGRIPPANAQGLLRSGNSGAGDESDLWEDFRPRHSASLRNITWRQGSAQYIMKYPGNHGDWLLKLELYEWKDIRNLESREWWKHAQWRSQTFHQSQETGPMSTILEGMESLRNQWRQLKDEEGNPLVEKSRFVLKR